LAAIALREFYPEIIEPFIEKKLSEARANCATALARYSLVDSAENGEYRPYYQCGIIIHSLIDKKTRELSQGKYSIFSVWNDFKKQDGSTGKKGAEGFWSATEKYIPHDMLQSLQQLTRDDLETPENYIEQLELQ
jgi:predicted metalloprotease with PDZ domain